ncbi:MAG: PDZ domain-containing protein [Cyanobacteria bacterium HKST-UBA02]|nr:PDZ domain-containing protein [Cyanobacteria bacterium HKST-UBA02]
MKRLKNIFSIALACILFLPGFAPGQMTDEPFGSPPGLGQFGEPPQGYFGGQLSPAQLEEIYKSIWAQIATMYYNPDALKTWAEWEHKFDGKLHSSKDLDLAVKSMVASLNDQWTRYISVEEQINNNRDAMSGLVSLGIYTKRLPDGRYQVDFIEHGSAAQRSALRRHDIIVSVDGVELRSMPEDKVDQQLKAPQGNQVEIVYQYGNQTGTAKLIALPVGHEPVIVRILAGKLLYIRFPGFDSPARTSELLSRLAESAARTGGALSGVILDLRGNPGGEFQEALKVASIFLERGIIVKSMTRAGRIVSNQTYDAIEPRDFLETGVSQEERRFLRSLRTAPMVTLVDGNTASAAEIVTGALKDNNRATVVGETTYGKGVGYVTGRGPTGGTITITGLQYLTPSGFNLAHKGIEPHLTVKQPREETNSDTALARAQELMSSKKQKGSL